MKFTFIPSTMSIVFVSFKQLQLPISIKVYVTIMQIFIFAWQLHLQIWVCELLIC